MLNFPYTQNGLYEALSWVEKNRKHIKVAQELYTRTDRCTKLFNDSQDADTQRIMAINLIDLVNKARLDYLKNQIVVS